MSKLCFKTKSIADIKDHKERGSFQSWSLKKNDCAVKVYFFLKIKLFMDVWFNFLQIPPSWGTFVHSSESSFLSSKIY